MSETGTHILIFFTLHFLIGIESVVCLLINRKMRERINIHRMLKHIPIFHNHLIQCIGADMAILHVYIHQRVYNAFTEYFVFGCVLVKCLDIWSYQWNYVASTLCRMHNDMPINKKEGKTITMNGEKKENAWHRKPFIPTYSIRIDWMDNCCVAVFCGDGIIAVTAAVAVAACCWCRRRCGSHSVRLPLLPLSLTRHTLYTPFTPVNKSTWTNSSLFRVTSHSIRADILLLYIRVFTRARKCLTK